MANDPVRISGLNGQRTQEQLLFSLQRRQQLEAFGRGALEVLSEYFPVTDSFAPEDPGIQFQAARFATDMHGTELLGWTFAVPSTLRTQLRQGLPAEGLSFYVCQLTNDGTIIPQETSEHPVLGPNVCDLVVKQIWQKKLLRINGAPDLDQLLLEIDPRAEHVARRAILAAQYAPAHTGRPNLRVIEGGDTAS